MPINKTLTVKSQIMLYWDYISISVIHLFTYFSTKFTLMGLLFVYSFFFNIDQIQLMLAMLFLVVFDTITGVYAAKVSGEQIESSKLIKAAFKLFIYSLLVASMHLIDKIMNLENFGFNLEIAVMGFLASTEGISILENVGRAGYVIPKKLLNALQKYRGDID